LDASSHHLYLDVAGVAADVRGAEGDNVAAGDGGAAEVSGDDIRDDEDDRVERLAVSGAGLVEGVVPDERGRVGEDPLREIDADGLVEPLAAWGVRRHVLHVERDGAGRSGRGQGQEGSDRGDVQLHRSCAGTGCFLLWDWLLGLAVI
jgi:hypothetical protein